MYGLELQKAIIRKDLKGHTKGGIYENLVFDMLTKRASHHIIIRIKKILKK